MNERDANACIIFITTAWVMNIAFSSIETALMIINKIRFYANKKRLEKNSNPSSNKIIPAIETNMDTVGNINYNP